MRIAYLYKYYNVKREIYSGFLVINHLHIKSLTLV